MDEVTKNYFTVPEIATINGLEVYQINYLLNKFHIVPADRFAGIRVYSIEQLKKIKSGVEQTKFRNRVGVQS